MTTIPANPGAAQEEWTDADFDLPEGQPLHTPPERDDDDDEDWDTEMDLGKTGGAKVQADRSIISSEPHMHIIRPRSSSLSSTEEDEEEDDEGLSTIKLTLRPKPKVDVQEPIDEDFEDGFSLPSDLTRLSLAPLSLSHRASKQSLDWEDKDTTSSSQSSDSYSTLGFADASPSTSSIYTAETDDEFEDDLEGLVFPSAVFDSGKRSKDHLARVLALREAAIEVQAAPKPTPDDDFEMDLIIDDDDVLSPTHLRNKMQAQAAQQPRLRRVASRSNSVPPQRQTLSTRPPSRIKSERSESPSYPPKSSARQLQKLRLSPSPPSRPPTRSQTLQAFPSPTPSPSVSSFLSPKPGSLRGQKSHSGLQPQLQSGSKRLTRKASLSSLMVPTSQPPTSSQGSAAGTSKARYDQPTAASRAKTQNKSSNRLHQEYQSLAARPSTPTSASARLTTMPAGGRFKIRPTLSSVFSAPNVSPRTSSPLPPRPPSTLSKTSRLAPPPTPTPSSAPPASKVLRKPKRVRTYGDGTELDAFDDLPTDRDKESRFRVQPKGYGNRIPGGSYASKVAEGSSRPSDRRSGSLAPTPSMRRVSKMDLSAHKGTPPVVSPPKKKKASTTITPPKTKRKPTLIRNLGSAKSPKVVGDMKWNPHSLRWEGNDDALKEFDAVVTSTRPALITQHHTGSSDSPMMALAAGARRVGNMIFDPARMCWISALPPEEDEPDVFANLADDEDDDDWSEKGGTIRATIIPLPVSGNSSLASDVSSVDSPASLRHHTRTPSECGSERGSRASFVCNVDETFLDRCREAEERHRQEMKAWRSALAVPTSSAPSHLYDIRALATRKY